MPKGIYRHKPKPVDPTKWAEGKKIVKVEHTDCYKTAVRVSLDDGSALLFSGYTESMMFNDNWSAVSVRVEKPGEKNG